MTTLVATLSQARGTWWSALISVVMQRRWERQAAREYAALCEEFASRNA